MQKQDKIKEARGKRKRGETLSQEEQALVNEEDARDKLKNARRSEIRKKRKNGSELNEDEIKTLQMLDKSALKDRTKHSNLRKKRKQGQELTNSELDKLHRLDRQWKKHALYDSELRKKQHKGEVLNQAEMQHLSRLKSRVHRANKKQGTRKKAVRRTAWNQRMQEKGTTDEIWTPQQVREIATNCLETLITNYATGETFNIETMLTTFGGYFGTTKRKLKEEALGWLTPRYNRRKPKRGEKYARSRPVLLNSDRSHILPMSQGMQKFGFNFIKLVDSTLRANVCAVEDFLQAKFQHLPLGKRLWRHVAKGAKFVDHQELCCVFFTYSFDLPKLLENGTVIVQK